MLLYLARDEIEFGFQVWREFPDRSVQGDKYRAFGSSPPPLKRSGSFFKTITNVLDGISGITKNIIVFHLKACGLKL